MELFPKLLLSAKWMLLHRTPLFEENTLSLAILALSRVSFYSMISKTEWPACPLAEVYSLELFENCCLT